MLLALRTDSPESITACRIVVTGLIIVEPAEAVKVPANAFPVIMSIPPKAIILPLPESADNVKLPCSSVVDKISSALRTPSPSVSTPTEPPLM